MTDLTDEAVKALLDEMTFAMFGDGTDDTISEKLARALLDARAELDTTQTQVGDWIVRADEAKVKVEKLEAELARVRADAAEHERLLTERDVEIARLREALTALVKTHDRENFMRSADFHREDCRCLRCAFDRARAALGDDNG